MSSLHDRKLKIVYEELRNNGWNRTITAENLEVSVRYIRKLINEMKGYGWEVGKSDRKRQYGSVLRSSSDMYSKRTSDYL